MASQIQNKYFLDCTNLLKAPKFYDDLSFGSKVILIIIIIFCGRKISLHDFINIIQDIVPGKSTIIEWFSEFKRGRTNINDV